MRRHFRKTALEIPKWNWDSAREIPKGIDDGLIKEATEGVPGKKFQVTVERTFKVISEGMAKATQKKLPKNFQKQILKKPQRYLPWVIFKWIVDEILKGCFGASSITLCLMLF